MEVFVYGDYGYKTERLYGEFATVEEASRFAHSNASILLRKHNTLEVAYFAPDGEYVTLLSKFTH